jgi:hypothetical protein
MSSTSDGPTPYEAPSVEEIDTAGMPVNTAPGAGSIQNPG